jgi:hypothetical protein
MKKWLKKIEDAMAAIAFAEAGEFETAKETLRERRKILLALRGERSDLNAFRYAVNMCKRIDAELEILYVSENVKDLLKHLKSELRKEGVEYLLIQKSGSIEKEIQDYISIKKNILFVVVEVSEGADVNSKKADKILSDAWKNLKCPLVVVSHTKTAFAT